MKRKAPDFNLWANVALLVLAVIPLSSTHAETPQSPLDVNDVSFLFPVPTNRAEVDALISLNDQAADGQIFSDALLGSLMDEAKTVSVGDAKISLPDEA